MHKIYLKKHIWVYAQSRVWLSCPPSFNTSLLRQAVTTGPCEAGNINNVPSFGVQAGSRLKVGWDSGNRGGGYVRLALAPANSLNQATFNQSVLKLTCFGYDSRDGRYALGNCNHPCDGRGGCSYQSNTTDNQRYDTTITVPYNLQNGDYVIQFTAFVGNSDTPIYSCSKITVAGGNPSLVCPAAPSIAIPDCVVALAPDYNSLITDSLPGQFCYQPDSIPLPRLQNRLHPPYYPTETTTESTTETTTESTTETTTESTTEPTAEPTAETTTQIYNSEQLKLPQRRSDSTYSTPQQLQRRPPPRQIFPSLQPVQANTLLSILDHRAL
ncbi:hypothetical protein BASA83_003360 [Batrachochytrium salamandrivorans]|nr:hypothetical protein BASA83_003360 [Batrachochytrium salamandrivorans]